MTVGTDDTQPLLGALAPEQRQAYTHSAAPLQDVADIAEPTTIVDFDPNGDAENPLEWASPFKWGVVSLLACMAFTV